MTIGRWRDSNDAKLVQRHSFPATVIQRPVQLYFRFTLSLRDVEEVIEVTRLRLLPRQFAVCIRIAIKLSRSSGKGLERRGANGSPGVRDFTVGAATEKNHSRPTCRNGASSAQSRGSVCAVTTYSVSAPAST